MQRRTMALLAGGLALLAVAAWVGLTYFAPIGSKHVEENAPEGARTLRLGMFKNADALHQVSGTVRLVQNASGLALRFEDYSATDGPDVYVYLTPAASPSGVADALRVLVPLGAKGGQATVRGSFNVPLDLADASAYHGVAIWCDRFDVLFGSAPLAPP